MKLAYFSAAVIPSQQANAVHVMKMCNAFAQLGHDVSLLYQPGSEVTPGEIYQYYGVDSRVTLCPRRISRWPGRNYWYGLAGQHVLRDLQPDVVVGRSLHGCGVAALRGWPVLFETHTTGANWRAAEKWLFARLRRARKFIGLTVITQPLKAHYLASGDFTDEQVLVAPDGADDYSAVAPIVLTGSGELQVGYVGSLYPGRGIDLIIDLALRCPWADFHVIGGDPDSVATVREATAKLPNFQLHGFVAPAKTGAFQKSFDIVLAPYGRKVSVIGGGDTSAWMSPLKVFEYMSGESAIICSDLPVLREVLRDGQNALLREADNVEAWQGAMELLRSNPELRKSIAATAAREFREKYTWRERARRIIRHFSLSRYENGCTHKT